MEFEKQYRIFLILAAIVFVVLFARIWQLMIFEGRAYKAIAEENASKTIHLPAPRGIIYDRNGKIIVSNKALFALYVIPHALTKDTLEYLARNLDISIEEVKAKIAQKKYRLYEPLLISDHLPIETVVRLEEEKNKYPGFAVMVEPVRFYPYGKAAAHVLGYVNWEEKGEEGVEAIYDEYLRGIAGGQKIEVDSRGRPIRIRGTTRPLPGNNITLNIDIEMQQAAEEALGNYEGAIVVSDPRNGEVLAMVSHPTFDPGSPAQKLDAPGHPFMNRALSHYPPGSTFKPVTLSAALQDAFASTSEFINCHGFLQLGQRIAKDWRTHGRVGVLEALTWSCDVAFYELALRMDPQRIARYAKAYGLGEKTNIDLTQEKKGLIPQPDWKRATLNEEWYRGDTVNMGIGQGFIQITPLQMAMFYGTLATGKRYRPFVVRQVVDRDGKIIFEQKPNQVGSAPISEKNLSYIKSALREVVRRGTGIAARVEGLPAAGKTGTAQNPGLPHAWFVAYTPYNNPEIVVSAFVAHGEHGDRAPAYMTRQLLEWYKKYRLSPDRVVGTLSAEDEFPAQYIDHGNYKEWYRIIKKQEGEE